jgi:DNA-binding NtrC family response regulator
MTTPDTTKLGPADTQITAMATTPACCHATKGVLLVEHDAPIREFFCEAIACRGIPIWVAANVAEALDLYHEHSAALSVVVVDEEFPEWNGPLLWEVLHRLNPRIKGCLITNQSANSTVENYAHLGVMAAFSKPLQVDDVLRTLELLIAQASRTAGPSDPELEV